MRAKRYEIAAIRSLNRYSARPALTARRDPCVRDRRRRACIARCRFRVRAEAAAQVGTGTSSGGSANLSKKGERLLGTAAP